MVCEEVRIGVKGLRLIGVKVFRGLRLIGVKVDRKTLKTNNLITT